jgi:hypothetical protein
MTDFYDDFVDATPVARTITRGKKTKAVYFRRLTAGERLDLVTGQTMKFVNGQRGDLTMDMGDITKNRHMLVKFTNVTAEGVQVFGDIHAVQAQPDWLVAELARLADEVNKDDEDAAPKS